MLEPGVAAAEAMGDLLARVVARLDLRGERRRPASPGARGATTTPIRRPAAEVDALLDADDLDGLRDRFGERLQFGTAGLRGALGAGPNRMNRALVRRATAGVAAWLHQQGLHGPWWSVGMPGTAAPSSPRTPPRCSPEPASGAVLPRPLPTPVTAFATLHLGAVAGIMITASHNPPQDNGYKLYLGDGAQIVPPVDEEISARIDAVASVADLPPPDDGARCSTTVVRPTSTERGLLDDGPREVRGRVHGDARRGRRDRAGRLRRAGFSPPRGREQVEPDPDFPTVAFPNPEEPGALDLLRRPWPRRGCRPRARQRPDADRLGVAIPALGDGGWRAHRRRDRDAPRRSPPAPGAGPTDLVATTVVSSRLLSKLAAAAGVAYGEALTGFKWVVRRPAGSAVPLRLRGGARLLRRRARAGQGRDHAALVAAELAAAARRGRPRRAARRARPRHGAHVTRQRSIRVSGATGSPGSPPPWPRCVTHHRRAVADAVDVEDLAVADRFPVPSDVLVWTLDGARAIVRPSGTEPKLKATPRPSCR